MLTNLHQTVDKSKNPATTEPRFGISVAMPQDSRARRHEKRRRAKKNALFAQKRAAEHAEADKPKTPAKKAT
jgi:hypothetical protein